MEPTILRFILFLGVEFLFLIASLLVSYIIGMLIFRTQKLKNGYALLSSFLAMVVSIFFMFIFVRVLTGENYFGPFMIIFVVSIALMLLVEFIWLMFGSTNIPWYGSAVWASYEFQKLHPNLNTFLHLCALAILIVYPIYIGKGYFGDIFASEDWKRYVLRSTIVILVGASWLAMFPNLLNLMTSKNIMEGTRSRIFISQLVNSASMLLLFSLFIWTTNSAGTTVSILGDYFVFSTTIGYVIAAYLVIVVILPYLIGHFRAKHWVQYLQLQRDEILDAATRAFSVPNINNAFKILSETEILIRQVLEKMNNDESMKLAYEVSETEDDQHLVYRIGLKSSLNIDPRFIHVNYLNELLDLVEECKSELEIKKTDKEKRETLKAYLDSLAQLKKHEVSNSTAWPLLLITSIVGPIISPILSSVGKLVAVHLGLIQQ